MTHQYKYMACHPIGRELLHPSLRFVDAKWSWVVGGNGTFSGSFPLPSSSVLVDQIRRSTIPKQSAIYVKNEDDQYIWGGPVISRTWKPDTQSIDINCMEWRAWLYMVPVPPELDMTADISYAYTSQDQTALARTLVGLVTGDYGSPSITMGTEALSGKLRDLSFYGTAFKSPGELIDTMGNRDGGFEWTIEVRADGVDGLPRLWFVTYFPERGSLRTGLMLKKTALGGNLMGYGPVVEDGATQYDRYWTTGVGQAPDIIFAQDTDPLLVDNRTLRFEGNASFNNVVNRSTLSSHARRARRFFAPGINLVNVTIPVHHEGDIAIGDRSRVMIDDSWMTVDLPAVRVVEKHVHTKENSVKLMLDLTDYIPIEVDEGGAV